MSLALLMLAMTFFFQNCGDGFQASFSDQSSSSTTGATPAPESNDPTAPILEPDLVESLPEFKVYMEPNIVNDCLTNVNYNACVFWKNPVAHQGDIFATPVTFAANLNGLQTQAINILGTDETGLLRNATINVTSSNGERVNDPDLNFKFPFDGTAVSARFATQVHVYHWMQTSITLMETDFGSFHAKGQNVSVDAISANFTNAFYRVAQNDVRLGTLDTGTPFGVNGEIAVHELGHANQRWGSGYDFNTVGTANCVEEPGTLCCTNKNQACGRSFAEGTADYAYGLVFPGNTTGGEALLNDLTAPSRCGLTRDFTAHVDLTIAQSCANIYALGMVYASIWHEVSRKAEVADPGVGYNEVNTLFAEHLMMLGNDTWQSTLNKIATLDEAMFQGKYTDLFVAEYQRHAIAINAPQ